MRILFWNQVYLPSIGGAEILTARLAAGLVGRGHDVAVAASRHAPGLSESEILDGVEVTRFPFIEALVDARLEPQARLKLTAGIIAGAARLKRQFRPDIVHVNLADANAYFHLRSARAYPAPMVVTFQAAVEGGYPTADGLLAEVIRGAARLIAHSRAGAANIERIAGLAPGTVAILPPGVPAADFIPRGEVEKPDPPTLVFLGRLVDCKGADTAIEAVARLQGRARLCIVGDGPDRGRLEAAVAARGLGPLVRFEGLVEDRRRCQILAQSFAMLVPSRHEELFGMVAVEGALSGLPVIASAIGGLTDILRPGETGFLCPPGDAAAMAAAVETLLRDPGLARRMGAAGRARALAEYSVERMTDAHERIYCTCLAQPLAGSDVARA